MSRLSERIENFNNAYKIFEKAVNAHLADKENDLFQMSIVQSFEVCFELAWKVLKDYLFENGISKHLPREVIKEAFSAEVIKNGELWIEMMQDRNATSHEYKSDKVKQIIEKISTAYFAELSDFQKGLDSWNG